MSNVPNPSLYDAWQQLIADAETIIDEYRTHNWDASLLAPGDVTVVTDGERRGVSVLIPDNQYESIERLVEHPDIRFDASGIYRTVVDGHILTLLVEKDEATKKAVAIPLSYTATDMESVVKPGKELRIHIRPLAVEEWVTFSHSDPMLFLPG